MASRLFGLDLRIEPRVVLSPARSLLSRSNSYPNDHSAYRRISDTLRWVGLQGEGDTVMSGVKRTRTARKAQIPVDFG